MSKLLTLSGKPPKSLSARRKLLDELLAPERVRVGYLELLSRKRTREPFDEPCRFGPQAAWSGSQLAARVEEAQAIVADEASHPKEALDAAINALERAAMGEAEDGQVEILAAILVDGFPNARPASPDGYVDALTAVIAEEHNRPVLPGEDRPRTISPHALAAAVLEAWRTLTFAPAPCEFLKLAQLFQRRLTHASDRLSSYREVRTSARWFLEDLGKLEPLPNDTDWSDPDAIPF